MKRKARRTRHRRPDHGARSRSGGLIHGVRKIEVACKDCGTFVVQDGPGFELNAYAADPLGPWYCSTCWERHQPPLPKPWETTTKAKESADGRREVPDADAP